MHSSRISAALVLLFASAFANAQQAPAWRGQMVRAEEGKKPRLLAILGDKDELGGYVKINDWNQIHIIARGNEMIHIMNGHVMSVFIDDDPTRFRKNGLIGIQIEGTGKVSFRNLWIKPTSPF